MAGSNPQLKLLPGTATDELKQGAFRPLEQTAYAALEHAASLKGFLKPFKGKGDLDLLRERCEQIRGDLIQVAMNHVLGQTSKKPFSMLPAQLKHQSTEAGTVFLRWRRVDRARMGVQVWEDLIADPKTPTSLLRDLYEQELQRIVINMQISLTHTIARQAAECAEKMAQAEATLLRRLDR